MNLSGGKIIIIGASDENRNIPHTIDKVMDVLTEAGLSPVLHHELPEDRYTPKCIIIGMGSHTEEILKLHENLPERGIIITCGHPKHHIVEEEFLKNIPELKLERPVIIESLVLTARSDIIGTPSLKKSVRYPHPKKLPTNKNYSTKPKGLRHGR